jgi:hypothetical protein
LGSGHTPGAPACVQHCVCMPMCSIWCALRGFAVQKPHRRTILSGPAPTRKHASGPAHMSCAARRCTILFIGTFRMSPQPQFRCPHLNSLLRLHILINGLGSGLARSVDGPVQHSRGGHVCCVTMKSWKSRF